MNTNFDPISLFLTSVNGNLRFLNQWLSRTFAIVLVVGIISFLVSILF